MTNATSNLKKDSARLQTTAAVRSGRLGLRTTPAQAALIQRAAEATQKSITEFILTSVCEKAEQTLLDQRYFMADEQSWKAFQDALERPAQVNKALQALITKPDVREKQKG